MTSASALVEVPRDPVEFTEFAVERGWGDGLPLIPPTPERVTSFLASWGVDADTEIARLPPVGGTCTAEKLAINAVMAGAPKESLPLLRAAVEAAAAPEFELHALNATTGSVVPVAIVNGPIRHRLNIPFGAGCLGGADGHGASIGRALRLVMRNVAGQRIGVTSQSVFGQPGRVSGIVFGEWEEKSAWAPLAERRGVQGDAVTMFGGMGTVNICDNLASSADDLLTMIGRSLPYPGANGYLTGIPFAEVVVAINPVWAEIIGRAYPDVTAVEQLLWETASLPLTDWPKAFWPWYEEQGRVDDRGRVRLARRREDILVLVAGGLGALHVAALHSWGSTLSQTRPVASS